MCTSFTLHAKDESYMLSRTMDFSIEMAKTVTYIPQNFHLIHDYRSSETYQTKYAYVGMGALEDHCNIVFDGINEQGLTAATLYFVSYAGYADPQAATTAVKVAPDMVVGYTLGNYASVNEVKTAFEQNQIQIVDEKNPTLGITPPLHYIFMDKTGATIVVEVMKDGVHVYDDTVGVMTNSPDYPWHENNLNNYLTVTPKQHKPVNWLGKELHPMSQGSGNFGLPGDFTPVARFVRAAYLKNFMPQADNEYGNLIKAENILKSVNVAKGAVVTENDAQDFSCYRSFMSATSQTYYFATYNNQRVRKIDLQTLTSLTEPKIFVVDNHEDILDITNDQ